MEAKFDFDNGCFVLEEIKDLAFEDRATWQGNFE